MDYGNCVIVVPHMLLNGTLEKFMTVKEGYSEWPDLERYSDIPVFNTKAVVQQTGIAAPTLRAWERRYKLLAPERAENDYRLYSERDVALIRWLKERVDAGMSISQAVALFRHISEAYIRLREEQKAEVDHPPAFHVALPEPPSEEDVPLSASDKEQEQYIVTKEPLASSIEHRPPPYGEHIPDHYHTLYNMHTVRDRLLDAFKVLDEATASMLMASMLAVYPVEQVCTELIVPALWQIGRLWEEGKITVSVEHFASMFFRGLLTNLLHATPASNNGPLVIVCCAPGEPHEIAPLMVALFLRRLRMRVIFLGQSIETAGLLHTIQQLTPVMVCISLTLPIYLSPLIDLARQIQALPTPHPIFAFGGQVFSHYNHLINQIPGIYLDGSLVEAVAEVERLIGELTNPP